MIPRGAAILASRLKSGHEPTLVTIWLDIDALRPLDDTPLLYDEHEDLPAELYIGPRDDPESLDLGICEGRNVLIAARTVSDRIGALAERLRLARALDVRSIAIDQATMRIYVREGEGI